MKELSGTKHRALDLDPLKCNDQQSKEAEKSLLKRKSERTRVTDKKTTLPPTISNLITKYVASIQSSFRMLGSAGGALDCEVKGKT